MRSWSPTSSSGPIGWGSSHGAIRFLQYARDLRSGLARADADIHVASDSGATAVIECSGALGIVAAYRALEVGIGKARDHGLGLVLTRHCNHVGRLGAYPEAAARQGYLWLLAPRSRSWAISCWRGAGSEGRLGTNPFAYGAPPTVDPIVGDFATSVIPEGRIRTARNTGELIPEGAATDASGRPTRDPAAFYGPPMGGLLPFGGAVGYKGHALGLLVELLGGTLAGDLPTAEGRPINGLWLLVIDLSRFLPAGRFEAIADDLVDYVRSSARRPASTGSASRAIASSRPSRPAAIRRSSRSTTRPGASCGPSARSSRSTCPSRTRAADRAQAPLHPGSESDVRRMGWA